MSKKEKGLRMFAGAAALSLTLATPGLVVAAGQYGSGSQAQTGVDGGQAGGMGSQQQASGQLMTLTVSELQGKPVVNTEGKRLGEIENIVKDKQTNQLHAVVSVGGFLGIGDKQVTLPVDQLSLNAEDQVVAAIDADGEQLQQRTAYDEQAYDPVQEEMSLAEASGAVPGGTAEIAAFEDLDRNRDGVISREEAESAGGALATNWQDADRNSDDQVDQSEFSAFEEQQQQPPSDSMMSPDAPGSMRSPDSAIDGGLPQGGGSAPATQPDGVQ